MQPIVYYLDRGAPEPIRSALLEGARWWNQAFEAAGYKNAFRVELMPEGADPMDLRYNVIQWVHRATRGWSYGGGVIDPRTGEIIKGHVTLGSLRVRQDFLIAEGLLAPYEKGKAGVAEDAGDGAGAFAATGGARSGTHAGADAQLFGEHGESFVGDGLSAAVREAGRRTACRILSERTRRESANGTKCRSRGGIRIFQPGRDEHAALNKILMKRYARGLRFLTDQDARPAGSFEQRGASVGYGRERRGRIEPADEVRAAALKRFGENNIREGAPLATIEDALVPIYMLHRYQVEAASKFVGGMDYMFALRGDGQVPTKIVAPAEQRRALAAVLATVKPAALVLPEPLLKMIPPRPPDYERGREHFKIRTSPAFDALAPAEAAAQHTLQFLFNPERAARLVEFHARGTANPGLEEVLDAIVAATWKAPHGTGYWARWRGWWTTWCCMICSSWLPIPIVRNRCGRLSHRKCMS